MRIIELSKEECYARLDKPHNPPDTSIPSEEFVKEYDVLYAKAEAIFSEFGENDAYGSGDFNMEPAWGRTRGLGLEITKVLMITPNLLGRLQQLLIATAPLWEIHLRSDRFDYNVFVANDAVRFYRDSVDVLPQLANS